jgi:predicted RNase H-like nuclease (RuvC/YqgF family)
MCYLPAQKEDDMSEIHRDRELEHLESMLYTYKVENKSMDAENERLKQEIRKLLAEKDKLRAALENAQQARVSQGKAIIDANNEIERLRAALKEIRDAGPMTLDDQRWRIALAALGGE